MAAFHLIIYGRFWVITEDIHAIHASPITTESIARIGALYGIEEEIRGKSIEVRRSTRQARAKPLLESLRS